MPVREGSNLHLGNIRVTDRCHNAPLIGKLGKQAFRHGGNPALDDDDIIGRARGMARGKAAFNNFNVRGSGEEPLAKPASSGSDSKATTDFASMEMIMAP